MTMIQECLDHFEYNLAENAAARSSSTRFLKVYSPLGTFSDFSEGWSFHAELRLSIWFFQFT